MSLPQGSLTSRVRTGFSFLWGFPGGSDGKDLPEMQETWIRSLGQEDLLEKEIPTHSQYSCLRIPMDRGAWWTIVHGVAKSWTHLSN